MKLQEEKKSNEFRRRTRVSKEISVQRTHRGHSRFRNSQSGLSCFLRRSERGLRVFAEVGIVSRAPSSFSSKNPFLPSLLHHFPPLPLHLSCHTLSSDFHCLLFNVLNHVSFLLLYFSFSSGIFRFLLPLPFLFLRDG